MTILGIETSCDDTAIAVLEIINSKLEILSDIVSSQVKLHAPYGGVYPFLAKREHQKNLPLVFKKAMKQAGDPKIDTIAITKGPGLEPCLWQGINFANDLAQKMKAPLFPINHVEAHILANFISRDLNDRGEASIKLPAVCLVVSGGHTQLVLMKKFLDYKILGETRDDAAGECFDKVARILGLEYPGGPAIAKLAKIDRGFASIKLPRPMIKQKNYDFSFSGLKTAVLYHHQKQSDKIKKDQKYIQAMCAEVQQAIIDVLISKTKKAVNDYRAKTVILGGGVVANDELRKQFKSAIGKLAIGNWKIDFLVPPKNLCTDNAAMVAATAYFHLKKGEKPQKNIEAKADLTL